jgi:N-acetylmuramoyl-L-alanine amidase
MPEHRPAPGILRAGDRGEAVAELRQWLAKAGAIGGEDELSPVEATFDHDLERAVRAFQQHRGITADGIAGPATWQALEEAHWRLGDRVLVHRAGTLLAGDDVIALQRRLLGLGFKVGRVDGRFGPDTERAVKEFQRNVGIHPDGTCGPATLKALARLAPIVGGGSPNAMRAEERIRTAGPSLAGKVVVIDAAGCQVGDP